MSFPKNFDFSDPPLCHVIVGRSREAALDPSPKSAEVISMDDLKAPVYMYQTLGGEYTETG